jgi:hypothetical protein
MTKAAKNNLNINGYLAKKPSTSGAKNEIEP